jgi:hypothetical protein
MEGPHCDVEVAVSARRTLGGLHAWKASSTTGCHCSLSMATKIHPISTSIIQTLIRFFYNLVVPVACLGEAPCLPKFMQIIIRTMDTVRKLAE